MRTLITSEEMAAFRRCRRQWDLGAPSRRNLEPVAAVRGADVANAIREALAVYYFPGMWDWDRSMVEGLALAALPRCLPTGSAEIDMAERVLSHYFGWAPSVDEFAPIRITSAYEARLPDPLAPEHGLLDARGMPVDVAGGIDMLVTDEADRYWVFRHRVAHGDWTSENVMRLSDADVADCWGWQVAYPGLIISGTVFNELRIDLAGTGPTPPCFEPIAHEAQHVAGGGGRSIPQHQRAWVGSEQPVETTRVDAGDAFRRTWIPRTQQELEVAGLRVGRIALDMLEPSLPVYPTPSAAHCPVCPFQDPCIAMNEGRPTEEMLAAEYRSRRPGAVESGRLGATTWGIGRGAAPPQWRESPVEDDH